MLTWLRKLIDPLYGHAKTCNLRTSSRYCTGAMRWRKERTRKPQSEPPL